MSFKVLPIQTFCDSLKLCFPTAPGGTGEGAMRAGATHSKAQKENIPVLAVQDPSWTDHILFVIAPSPARSCYLQTAAGTKRSSQQITKTQGLNCKEEQKSGGEGSVISQEFGVFGYL